MWKNLRATARGARGYRKLQHAGQENCCIGFTYIWNNLRLKLAGQKALSIGGRLWQAGRKTTAGMGQSCLGVNNWFKPDFFMVQNPLRHLIYENKNFGGPLDCPFKNLLPQQEVDGLVIPYRALLLNWACGSSCTSDSCAKWNWGLLADDHHWRHPTGYYLFYGEWQVLNVFDSYFISAPFQLRKIRELLNVYVQEAMWFISFKSH